MRQICQRECSRNDRPCIGVGGQKTAAARAGGGAVYQWQKSLLITKKFWGSARKGASAAAQCCREEPRTSPTMMGTSWTLGSNNAAMNG
jgi:hypothetical protein